MSKTKYAIVVDASGHAVILDAESYAKAFVIVNTHIPTDDEGNAGEPVDSPEGYTMREGERLIYESIQAALAMLKPRWTGKEWVETASPEEVDARKPPPYDPDKEVVYWDDVSKQWVVSPRPPTPVNDSIFDDSGSFTPRMTSLLDAYWDKKLSEYVEAYRESSKKHTRGYINTIL